MFDVLDELEAAVEKLATSEAETDVARLSQLAERLEYQRLRAVAALDRSAAWQSDGALSTASWLRANCRLTHGAAAACIRLARRLESLPATSAAFEAGVISRRHAQVIADAYTPERADALAGVEPELVDVARRVHLQELRSLVSYVTDAIDGDGGAATATQEYERRRLHVSRLLDGMVAIDGLLDRDAGEIVLTALNAAMDTPQAGDMRSSAQRRADALVDLCQVGMSRLATGPGRARRPQVNIAVGVEVIERRAGIELARHVHAEAANVGQLSAETLRRISCDAGIARVITQGDSQPLDVGRTTRTVPSALWRALVVRDGGCVAPGCDRPPGWCDAHHRVHWADGGETSLANCELRCRRHHRAVHEGGGRDPPDP
jgi:hypothetical protein